MPQDLPREGAQDRIRAVLRRQALQDSSRALVVRSGQLQADCLDGSAAQQRKIFGGRVGSKCDNRPNRLRREGGSARRDHNRTTGFGRV